jgi:RNA polymerase sigma-70 factor, ECF subfamily
VEELDPIQTGGVTKGVGDVGGERLYNIAGTALRRVLRGRTIDYDDLLQTALERVIRSVRDRSFTNQCSFPTWVSVIAANVAIDWARSNGRGRARLEFVEDLEQFDADRAKARAPFEGQLEARSALRYVESLMENMSPGQSDPFVLYDVCGLDLNEIAGLLQISVAAAQSRLVRARHELRRRLEALDVEEEASPLALETSPPLEGTSGWRAPAAE